MCTHFKIPVYNPANRKTPRVVLAHLLLRNTDEFRPPANPKFPAPSMPTESMPAEWRTSLLGVWWWTCANGRCSVHHTPDVPRCSAPLWCPVLVPEDRQRGTYRSKKQCWWRSTGNGSSNERYFSFCNRQSLRYHWLRLWFWIMCDEPKWHSTLTSCVDFCNAFVAMWTLL